MIKKLNLIKTLLVVFAIAVCSFAFISFAPHGVAKANEEIFQMENSTYLRVDGNGLRFGVKMNEEVKNKIDNNLYFILMPASYLEYTGTDYAKVIARDDQGNFDQANSHCLYLKVKNNLMEGGEYWYAFGGIANVLDENRALDFVAIACIETNNAGVFSYQFADFATDSSALPKNNLYNLVNTALLDKDCEFIDEIITEYDWIGSEEFPLNVETKEQYNSLVTMINNDVTAFDSMYLNIDGSATVGDDVVEFESGKSLPSNSTVNTQYKVEVYAFNGTEYALKESNSYDKVAGETVNYEGKLAGYILNPSISTLSATVSADGSTVLKAYFEKGVDAGNNVYLSSNKGTTAVIEKQASVPNSTEKADKITFTKSGRYEGLEVVGLKSADVASNGYKKISMKIKASESLSADRIFFYALYNNDIGTTSAHEIRLNTGNIGSGTTSYVFRMYSEQGERIYEVPSDRSWFTLEISFYRAGYIICDDSDILALYIYANDATAVDKPFYIKDVKVTADSIDFYSDTTDGLITANYQARGYNNSDNINIANVSANDITSNGYQKVTMKIKAGEGFDASTIFVYAKYNNNEGGVSEHEIRLNTGNIGSGTTAAIFRMYTEAGERIYDVPSAGTWFTLEISFYRAGYLITETNGKVDLYMYVGNTSTLNKPFYIKDVRLTTDTILFYRDTENGVMTVNYQGTGTKDANNFRITDAGVNDITTNGYKKVTMKIKASEGFDASTIFVYAKYNNDIGTTSFHEIRLNTANIGSGTPATVFRMYNDQGERIYDVPSAGEWFTLEITFYRAGYLVTESNGTADIYMYVGNGKTLNKPFQIKDVTLSTEAI